VCPGRNHRSRLLIPVARQAQRGVLDDVEELISELAQALDIRAN
jgi:hypothetical protein